MSLISAIIMASGFSRRMGENKLLMKYNNKFLIEYTLDVISKCNFKDKLIVTQYEKIKEIGENLDFKVVKNKYPNRGISESIKLGIKNCEESEGYMFFVGDQPLLDKKDIEKLNMNTFLAVAKGSLEEPKFIKMKYKGTKDKQKPIVLVGKGITFDSGGISIKPSANMDEMKFDMCGAATVMATFLTVAKLNLPINLIAVVPTCENMPSGSALKPGDVIKTMSGQTVEVANTDAEGRLILCDALTYVKKYEPQLVIDIATLTGACVIALGNVASGLYSNDDKLASALITSANKTNDKVWQMPLFEEYHEQLKGNTADISNIGGWGGKGGSVTAACFLAKFVDYKWAHLDIAGTAWNGSFSSTEISGATGRPFYLLMDFLRNHSS